MRLFTATSLPRRPIVLRKKLQAIVTKTAPRRDFYPAEDYHQDFLTRNPNYPYIVVNDLPKIEALKRLFPDLYRPTPVLLAAAAPRN
jgi:peptide-methionine (S)-S-oxide reductase